MDSDSYRKETGNGKRETEKTRSSWLEARGPLLVLKKIVAHFLRATIFRVSLFTRIFEGNQLFLGVYNL